MQVRNKFSKYNHMLSYMHNFVHLYLKDLQTNFNFVTSTSSANFLHF